MLHQQFAQPKALPFLGHNHGAFAAVIAFCRCVAAEAYFGQLVVVLHDQGDIGHALLVVDVHDLVESQRGWFVVGGEEAEVVGLWRQACDESELPLPVVLLDRSDQQVRAVAQFFDPVDEAQVRGVEVVADLVAGDSVHVHPLKRRTLIEQAVFYLLRCGNLHAVIQINVPQGSHDPAYQDVVSPCRFPDRNPATAR